MADIALTAAQVRPIDPVESEIIDLIASVAITKGQVVYIDTAGKAAIADGSAAGTAQARGIALESVGAGQVVSVLKRGRLAGFTVSGLNGDARLYLSATAGALADAAAVVAVTCGRVVVMNDGPTLTKVAYFDFDWLTQHA